jgi:hypothetical protein
MQCTVRLRRKCTAARYLINRGVVEIPPFKHIKDLQKVTGGEPALESFYNRLSVEAVRSYGELDSYLRHIVTVNEALATWKAEGFAEGFAEGVAEVRAEVALKMLSDGFDVGKIAKYSSLSLEDLQHLKVSLIKKE